MEIFTLCISLLSFFAALAAVIVAIVIYKKDCKKQEIAEKERRKREEQETEKRRRLEKQALQDELDSMNEHSPFPLSETERCKYARINYLQKRLRRM